MLTFGQLKADIRERLFPDGEASNLVKAHDKFFIDALIDLQTWVDCQQQDNTNLYPHCSTFYKCGMTVIDQPRGIVKGVSVIDKFDYYTGLESASAADEWCSEIGYREVDYCHIQRYFSGCSALGYLLPIPFFFDIPTCLCPGAVFPTATDEGVPTNLPALPLGFHYPQSSTDRTYGRNGAGVWAKDRGKIYIAPWIQGTETVVVKWDGIKREWSDADQVDSDPLLTKAVELYVGWQHTSRFDHEFGDAADMEKQFMIARQDLMHQCREETRVRGCETSNARASAPSSLFYNTEQSATAQCADNETGSPVSVTIQAGTVASVVSVADANQKAKDEAQRQAEARLDCVAQTASYENEQQTATVSCTGDGNSPPPEGTPVTVTLPAGTVTSTISQADANAQALALAQQQAADQLQCVYWNAFQTYTASCVLGVGADVTKTTASHMFSSTVSQLDADAKALNSAKAEAEAALSCTGGASFWNTQQVATKTYINCRTPGCTVSVQITVPANKISSNVSQADANAQAAAAALGYATARAGQYCAAGLCGSYSETWPT